ncbi:MAG TPA: hypothetical protein VGO08_09210 [Burkholderiales bacterium]|nr:hypothetical protein [Burkholderiales bacterium]
MSIATWTLVANAAGEPAFPHRPIRLVTSEVGGSADIGARLLAQGLTGRLGQQVIVDNRGSGIIPGDIVSTRRGCRIRINLDHCSFRSCENAASDCRAAQPRERRLSDDR